MCPPSARLGEQFPDTASEYAAAGTLAHAIAELKARKYFVEPMSNRAFNARLKKLKEDPHYDKGMDAATDTYLEHLKALAMSYGSVQPFVALETRALRTASSSARAGCAWRTIRMAPASWWRPRPTLR